MKKNTPTSAKARAASGFRKHLRPAGKRQANKATRKINKRGGTAVVGFTVERGEPGRYAPAVVFDTTTCAEPGLGTTGSVATVKVYEEGFGLRVVLGEPQGEHDAQRPNLLVQRGPDGFVVHVHQDGGDPVCSVVFPDDGPATVEDGVGVLATGRT